MDACPAGRQDHHPNAARRRWHLAVSFADHGPGISEEGPEAYFWTLLATEPVRQRHRPWPGHRPPVSSIQGVAVVALERGPRETQVTVICPSMAAVVSAFGAGGRRGALCRGAHGAPSLRNSGRWYAARPMATWKKSSETLRSALSLPPKTVGGQLAPSQGGCSERAGKPSMQCLPIRRWRQISQLWPRGWAPTTRSVT